MLFLNPDVTDLLPSCSSAFCCPIPTILSFAAINFKFGKLNWKISHFQHLRYFLCSILNQILIKICKSLHYIFHWVPIVFVLTLDSSTSSSGFCRQDTWYKSVVARLEKFYPRKSCGKQSYWWHWGERWSWKKFWSPNYYIIVLLWRIGGLHGGVVVSTVASQQEESQLGLFCVKFACSPCAQMVLSR